MPQPGSDLLGCGMAGIKMTAKELILSGSICLMVLLFGGCQDSGVAERRVEVLVAGGGIFPESLAGRWQAETNGWEFVFEADGTISSAVISLGRTRIVPGQTTVIAMRKGGKGIYEPGKWWVEYVPETRELTVEVVMKRLRLEFGDDLLEGSSKNVFSGRVSEDGRYWWAEWIQMPTYVIYTPERYELPFDPEGSARELVFEKTGGYD
jgi:hypothetical protein